MDWNSFGSSITGAILGGLIAGLFALIAVRRSSESQKEQSTENEAKIIKGLLQAIHDEIETVFDRYQETMGAYLDSLESEKPLLMYYPVVSDFFTVYNGNSFLIGRIPDHDLRKQIIKTYTLSKGMVDSFRMNNDLVAKYDFAEKLFAETGLGAHQNQAVALYTTLVRYAASLKESHKTLKQEVSSLLRQLRKKGVLSENAN